MLVLITLMAQKPKEKMTPALISRVMAEMGRKGGKAGGKVTGVKKGTAALNPAERRARAKQAAAARWGQKG